MRRKSLYVLMTVLLVSGFLSLTALQEPALAAERIVEFDNPGCA